VRSRVLVAVVLSLYVHDRNPLIHVSDPVRIERKGAQSLRVSKMVCVIQDGYVSTDADSWAESEPPGPHSLGLRLQ
jgi:hypothetical protein